MELKEVIWVIFFEIQIQSIVECKESLRIAQGHRNSKCTEFPLTKTFDLNKQLQITGRKQVAKVSYLIISKNLMFLTDFLISGKRVPAQTTEPGLHLVSKAGRDVCRNGSRRHFHSTKKIVNRSQ
jgi:hypothetical protein